MSHRLNKRLITVQVAVSDLFPCFPFAAEMTCSVRASCNFAEYCMPRLCVRINLFDFFLLPYGTGGRSNLTESNLCSNCVKV